MSENAYQRLAGEVGARNEQRYDAAIDDLKKRGYTPLAFDEGLSFAALEEPGPTRCQDAAYGLDRLDAGPLGQDAPLRIVIGEMTPAGEPSKSSMHVVAPARQTCAFFHQPRDREGGDELTVTKEGGQIARLVHAGGQRMYARHVSGEVFIVDFQRHVVSTRKLLVKRTCNRMPGPEPDPLDRAAGVPVRWAPSPVRRAVVVKMDYEDLSSECTDYVE